LNGTVLADLFVRPLEHAIYITGYSCTLNWKGSRIILSWSISRYNAKNRLVLPRKDTEELSQNNLYSRRISNWYRPL